MMNDRVLSVPVRSSRYTQLFKIVVYSDCVESRFCSILQILLKANPTGTEPIPNEPNEERSVPERSSFDRDRITIVHTRYRTIRNNVKPLPRYKSTHARY